MNLRASLKEGLKKQGKIKTLKMMNMQFCKTQIKRQL